MENDTIGQPVGDIIPRRKKDCRAGSNTCTGVEGNEGRGSGKISIFSKTSLVVDRIANGSPSIAAGYRESFSLSLPATPIRSRVVSYFPSTRAKMISLVRSPRYSFREFDGNAVKRGNDCIVGNVITRVTRERRHGRREKAAGTRRRYARKRKIRTGLSAMRRSKNS